MKTRHRTIFLKRTRLLILTGCMGFAACSRNTQVKGEINNYSDDTVTVIYRYPDTTLSYILVPNTSINTLRSGVTGTRPRKFNCCPCDFNFIEISPKNPAKKLLKSISTKDNWKLDKSRPMKNGIRCAFTIEHEDIQ